jgi:3-dehydroquinate synthase
MLQLEVNLPGYAYPILFAPELLSRPDWGQDLAVTKAAVVSDENVWALHGETLSAALTARGITFNPIIFPPGETSKSLASAQRLYQEFYRCGLGRGDAVIAFGGGVIGDLAGFAAATYMRGLPLLQIPTTLLAQVDSSVGGKVAVNLPEGKNLVGSFYQPRLVLADTALLATLPEREWRAGMAEVIKYAALAAGELSALLVRGKARTADLERVIYLCCASKTAYVQRDELDQGERMMLNLGHSFAHAIEKRYAFQRFNHGEAVARGLVLAARTGESLGLSVPGTSEKLCALLELYDLDFSLDEAASALVPLMTGDKKNRGGELTLILLKQWGQPFLYNISPEKLTAVLNSREV